MNIAARQERVAPINKNEQFTPRWVADFARTVFGQSIALDPTSSPIANEVIGAAKIYTIDDDALTQSWQAKTLFFNPPYGVGLIAPMIAKLLEELPGIDQAIVLVNSSTCAGWYQSLLSHCDRFLLPKQRINFWTAEGCPPDPEARIRYQTRPPGGNLYDQTLFYFGRNTTAFEEHGASIGTVSAPAKSRPAIFDRQFEKSIESPTPITAPVEPDFDQQFEKLIEKIQEGLDGAIVDICDAIGLLSSQGVASMREVLAAEEKGGKIYHRVIQGGRSKAIKPGEVADYQARIKRRKQSSRLATVGDRINSLKRSLDKLRS